MKTLLNAFAVTSLSTVFAMAGLVSSASAEDAYVTVRYIPVKEQRRAILDCRYDMGFRGRSVFGGVWPETPSGGQTTLWIAPDANLSAHDADRINACADVALDRTPTPLFAMGGAGSVTDHGVCPPGAPVIFGGATYCIGTR